MKCKIINNTLTDGSQTADVEIFDGTRWLVFHAIDQTAAEALQSLIEQTVEGVTVHY